MLLGADATGRNVFFVTKEPLVPQDGDAVYDMYSAPIAGGFPYDEPPLPCRGDACQGTLPEAPAPVTPASADLHGDGNVTVRPAPRRSVALVAWSRAEVARAARSGRLTVRVRVPEAGTATALATARISGLNATVARASARARRAATVALRLRLSRRAVSVLRRNGVLPVRVTVRFSKAPGARSRTVALRLPRAATTAKGR
jgi:hypothetical protein